MDSVEKVRVFYDGAVESEWNRILRHPVEYAINKRFLALSIKPGDSVLDLGGGPGRYALWLAERGCRVTLADLSPANVAFALAKAEETGLAIRGYVCDGRDLSRFADASFDHVLCMGPMYHLREEADRERTVRECLRVQKPGGILAASFISSYAGVLYYLKFDPAAILLPEKELSGFKTFLTDGNFAGVAFTENYFIRHGDILPFFSRFGLEPLHLLSSESILSPYEPALLQQPPAVMEAWIDFGEQVCEREDLLGFAEHYLYIGRKVI